MAPAEKVGRKTIGIYPYAPPCAWFAEDTHLREGLDCVQLSFHPSFFFICIFVSISVVCSGCIVHIFFGSYNASFTLPPYLHTTALRHLDEAKGGISMILTIGGI